MKNWLNDYRADRKRINDRIDAASQAEVARLSGLSEMAISRFRRGVGTDDARDMYRIASAVGLTMLMVPEGSEVFVKGDLFECNPRVRPFQLPVDEAAANGS